MSPLDLIPAPYRWLAAAAVGAMLVAALGVQTVRLADAQADLAKEKGGRATENQTRTEVAAADEKQTAGAEKQHAVDQQGISYELAQTKQDLAVARAGRAGADRRVRDTASKLAAARAQLEARGDAAAPGSCEDQHRSAFGLLEEGFRLSVEARSLAVEGGDIVAERDAEVKALMAQIRADRALMLRAAGREGLRVPAGFESAPAALNPRESP